VTHSSSTPLVNGLLRLSVAVLATPGHNKKKKEDFFFLTFETEIQRKNK
jgi:hypothetical protein